MADGDSCAVAATDRATLPGEREALPDLLDRRELARLFAVKEFIDGLSDTDAAAVIAAMKDVEQSGLPPARRLRGEIYEVRADGDRQVFRILFASEGRRGQVLLSLEAFARFSLVLDPGRRVELRLVAASG